MSTLSNLRISRAYESQLSQPFEPKIERDEYGYFATDENGGKRIALNQITVFRTGEMAIDELIDSVGGWYDGFRSISPLKKTVYGEDLWVDSAYRGKGLARRMLETMISDYGADHQIVIRALDTDGGSTPQQLAGMYSKFGFREIVDLTDEGDGIVMVRDAG